MIYSKKIILKTENIESTLDQSEKIFWILFLTAGEERWSEYVFESSYARFKTRSNGWFL